MNSGSFRFALGEFECVSINDGAFNYPVESTFAKVPLESVEEALRQQNLPTEQITLPYTFLFVNTGRHRVLIDMGAGNLEAHAAEIFPSIDHSTTVTGKLLENMESVGIEPSDVDTVVITHAHPDHVGGTLDEAERLVFANARYFVAKDEWDFWTSDAATTKAPAFMVDFARRNLEPLQDVLTFLDDASEIVPGIRAIAAYGHTPGHLALSIASDGEQLLHIADAALHPLHLEQPRWSPAVDMLPEQAIASKHRLVSRAAEEEMLVFAHHFPPFPNLGHILKKEDGWLWQPIDVER